MAFRIVFQLALAACLLAPPAAAHSDAPLAERAAQVTQDSAYTQALYDVRKLQVYYSQFAQFGQWTAMAELFAERGELIHGDKTIRGKRAIARWLAETYGDGAEGLGEGATALLLPFSPIVNLSEGGVQAEARWHELSMLGKGPGDARWEGGIYENDYILEDGKWKIARQHYHPMVAGTYEEGWRNVMADMPVVPYHYTPGTAGIPIPQSTAPAPAADPARAAAQVEAPLAAMLAENEIRNLQNIYGYYADRRMWDDVADLFAAQGTLDIAGVGRWNGQSDIRRALEREGPAGLPAGVLNDHLIFPLIVTLSGDRRKAQARGIELGMKGENRGEGFWTVTTFENTFVWQDGTWRIEAMRLFPQLRSNVKSGWGTSRLEPVKAEGVSAPEAPSAHGLWSVPAFSYTHPVSGREIAFASRTGPVTAIDRLPGGRAGAASGDARAMIGEAERKLRLLIADVGTVNVSNAFGNYIDDFEWEMLGQTFARKGAREMPYAGFYIGPERIAVAEITKWGHRRTPRRTIPVHLRMQPVIDVSADGRSTRFRTRLFSYMGSYDSPGIVFGGMYPNDQAVLEDDSWKLWSVAIDEFYMRTGSHRNWWVDVAAEPAEKVPDMLIAADPPDIPLTALGRREQGFIPGSTQFNPYVHNGPAYPGYPSATPMWFHYVNPVSGRVPQFYWPDCATCAAHPETSFEANGY